MSDANKPKVLIIIGDASETVDTMYPYFRLIEGGYEPVLAAPEKRTYQMVMHCSTGKQRADRNPVLTDAPV